MKVFYSDEAGTFKVKYFRQDGTVEVIAGNGFETNNEGRAENFFADRMCETYSHNKWHGHLF